MEMRVSGSIATISVFVVISATAAIPVLSLAQTQQQIDWCLKKDVAPDLEIGGCTEEGLRAFRCRF